MNLKEPYLPLEEARSVVAEGGRAWRDGEHASLANSEGWTIVNLYPERPDGALDAGIAAYDDPTAWDGCDDPLVPAGDDAAVIEHLRRGASEGGARGNTYRLALRIEHAIRSMRLHVRGEHWVDERGTYPTT